MFISMQWGPQAICCTHTLFHGFATDRCCWTTSLSLSLLAGDCHVTKLITILMVETKQCVTLTTPT